MRKIINVDFKEGETVVLKTNPEVRRVVSGYLIRGKSVTYGLEGGEEETWHPSSVIERLKSNLVIKGFKG